MIESPSSVFGTVTSFLEDAARPSLLKFGGPIETVSVLPGRVRFRSAAVKGNEAAETAVVESLIRLPGVASVEVNPVSGSILVRHDKDRIAPDLLLVALLKILGLEEEFLRTPISVLSREITDFGESLNRTVFQLTGGLTDLRTAALVALLVVGIAKLRRDWGGAWPGGVTLLWWASTSLFQTKPGDS